MWRALHFNLGPDAPGRLLLAVHHLVVDGVSWRTLREDLESLYFQVTSGGLAEPVPDQTSSMQAWAKALCRHAQSAAVQNTFPYWHTLAGKPGLTLPHHAAGQTPFAATGLLVTRLSRDETRALLQQVPALFQSQINDALLMALSKALHDSTGSRTLRIDLEGHGREHIDDSLDVSRTIGWFTSLFPIALDVEPGGDTVDLLLSVKDQLQRVPDRGLSYGLLRYLSDDAKTRDALAGTAASPVLFNYLGQFDAVVTDSALFSFATESTGPWRSPGARRTHALEIVSLVRDGQLEMAWHHDAEAHHAASIAQLAKGMLDALIDLTARADPSRRRAATPADFPLAQLDAASLARLGSRFPQLQDVYPLTPMQRLFFAMESSSGNLGFEQWHFRLDGAVDGERLKRAIGHVIERHPILRTAVVAEGGAEPLQVVSSGVVLPWSDEDWRDLPAAAQSQRLAELLASDTAAGFDLAQAPLMRVALRRVADESAHLIWSTHHLCIDGWSWPIVFADVSRAYSALEAGREVLFETAAPYRRYVEWLAHSAPQSEAFWKAQLAPFDAPTPLPLRAPSAAEMTPSDETFTDVVVSLPATITNELQAWARGSRVTLSAVFNAAWSLVLGHYSAAEHVVFGAAFSGRPAEIEGIESLVGSCVNNLPMRVKVEPATPLGAWLTEMQQLQFDIAQHQYAPLEQIQQWAAIPWRHRLFDSLVVFQNYQVDADARRIGANVHSTLLSAPEATNYALTLAVAVEAQLRIRLLFKPGVLARADVARIADDLITVLSTMAGRAKATVGDILALLPAESRGQARAAASVRTAARRRALYSAPSSVAEREIAAVWQDLFGVDQVSLDDNFFDLGGHSMLLVQAHARLKVSLRTDLPIVALLQFPTVRSLARHLSRDAAADGAKASSAATDRARLQREGQMRQKSIAGRRQQP